MNQALESETYGPAKVLALFEAFARRVEQADFRRSCPFGCVALDLDDDTEPLRAIVLHFFRRLEGQHRVAFPCPRSARLPRVRGLTADRH